MYYTNELEPENLLEQSTNAIDLNLNQISSIMSETNQIVTNLTPLVSIASKMRENIHQMDCQLEAFSINVDADLSKFEAKVKVLESQIERYSKRMDNILAVILSNDFSQLDEANVKNREMLINMLISMNDTFNNMIIKLL